MKKVVVEVISDTVCPWCYVGKLRLERAMESFKGKVDFEVHWLPFQLNRDAPKQGVNKLQMYNEKFGSHRVAAMTPHMTQVFKEEGVDYSIGGLTGNTFDSHRLINWAGKAGPDKQDAVVSELFRNYFEEEKFINDPEVLVAAADKAGLAGAREYLADDRSGAAEVERELRTRAAGITGVPFFIIDGRYRLSGAQDPEVLERVFQKLIDDALAQPDPSDGAACNPKTGVC